MTHESRASFSGDAGAVLDRAVDQLATIGFMLTDRSSTSRALAGPGMRSTRQPPLVGAAEIVIEREGGEMVVRADLGGIRTMKLFLWIFPPSLCLFIGASIALTNEPVDWTAVALPALPWLIISPLMSRFIERRTRRALDAWLHTLTSQEVSDT